MAEITAAMVKALREETGQGMMECKKALQETNGDTEAAKDLLRKRGLATAEKKASRVTKEGLIGICAPDDKSAGMVEVQCETDFTARNEEFQSMVRDVAALVAAAPADGPVEATDAMKDLVQAILTKTGENMSYARGVKISAPRVATYLHHNQKVGVILGVDGELDDQTLADLCMHICFADPMGASVDDVPAELVEKERKFATEQAAESGKPADIVAKMVEGKVRKFVAANALLEQNFVKDETRKIKEVLGKAKITAFARFAIGG